ncbi:hypothetical protein HYV79_04610 [Candidatus Woesearchaeota archaeon]|nr:hypothetical protein [Candidatus Woesearchaeota archaeon]
MYVPYTEPWHTEFAEFEKTKNFIIKFESKKYENYFVILKSEKLPENKHYSFSALVVDLLTLKKTCIKDYTFVNEEALDLFLEQQKQEFDKKHDGGMPWRNF